MKDTAVRPEAVRPRDVLTTVQVAELLQVTRRTVERLHIPYAKVGRLRRYLRADVLAYLRAKAS